MLNLISNFSLNEINQILFLSFGLWFSLICFIQMVVAAVRILRNNEEAAPEYEPVRDQLRSRPRDRNNF